MLKRQTFPKTAAAVAALVLLLGACSEDADDSSEAEDASSETTPTDAPEDADTDDPGDAAGGEVSCVYSPSGQPPAKEASPPPADAEFSGPVDATIQLSAGEVGLTLDADAAPCTVNSFASLAEQQYFADTECHRLTEGAGLSVLQCGDPLAQGFGGPGYSFDDELSGSETYPAGTLAMANSGPNTNGSQFFMVYEDSQLPPAYTVFGQMDEAGLEVVRGIAAEGFADGATGDGRPAGDAGIVDVTVN